MKLPILLLLYILSFMLPATLIAQTAAGQTPGKAAEEKSENFKTPEEFYNAGYFIEAADLFLQHRGSKRNTMKAYYNAARSFHQDYIVNNSIESLETAVDGYYRVLDLNPEHYESLINLELARQELEKHKDAVQQQEKQEEKNSRDSENSESSGSEQDDLKTLAEEQKNLADSQQDGENSQKQSELSQKTEQARDQSEANSQTRNALDQAVEKQKEALEQMTKGNNKEAKEAQQEAASFLSEAARNEANSDVPQEGDTLPQDIQSILNQEQSRNKNEQNNDDRIRVEKNW